MKKKDLIPIAAAASAVSAAFAVTPLLVRPAERKIASEHGRNWMSVLRDDVLLSQLAVPGTHDSAAEKIHFASISRCQHLTIAQQLEAGCRFLDVRLAVKDDRLILVHGITSAFTVKNGKKEEYTLDNLLESLYAFLRRNPTETVLVSIKKDRGIHSEQFTELFYQKYLQPAERYWFTQNRIPRLGEVRGKAVFLRRFHAVGVPIDDRTGGLNMSERLWFNMAGKTFGYKKFLMENLDDGANAGKVCLQDCYSLGVNDKWFRAVKPLIDRGRYADETVLNFMSCTGRLFPVAAALPLNRLFSAYDTRSLSNGSIMVLDYLDAPLAEKVYRENQKHTDPEKHYPAEQAPYSEDERSLTSDYILGYSNLLYKIFS